MKKNLVRLSIIVIISLVLTGLTALVYRVAYSNTNDNSEILEMCDAGRYEEVEQKYNISCEELYEYDAEEQYAYYNETIDFKKLCIESFFIFFITLVLLDLLFNNLIKNNIIKYIAFIVLTISLIIVDGTSIFDLSYFSALGLIMFICLIINFLFIKKLEGKKLLLYVSGSVLGSSILLFLVEILPSIIDNLKSTNDSVSAYQYNYSFWEYLLICSIICGVIYLIYYLYNRKNRYYE